MNTYEKEFAEQTTDMILEYVSAFSDWLKREKSLSGIKFKDAPDRYEFEITWESLGAKRTVIDSLPKEKVSTGAIRDYILGRFFIQLSKKVFEESNAIRVVT